MGNVLGNLFGDIATAIREKTGDTASMKPAEFPAKISAIETGGSGGGGSLTPGVYLSTLDITKGYQYVHQMFVLNGVRYATTWSGTTATNSAGCGKIIKYNNGVWETVLDSGSTTSNLFNSTSSIQATGNYGVIYHDKVHLFYNRSHGTFDGTSVATLNNFENTSLEPFVYNDKLLAYSYPTGSIHEWNESSDTWSVYKKISNSTSDFYYPIVINNTLYFTKSKNVYRYTDDGLVQVDTTLPYAPGTWKFKKNNSMYWIRKGYTQSYVYKYDFTTNVGTTVGMVPNSARIDYTITENMDEISFVMYSNTSANNCYPEYLMHIVEEST